ncbi:uncharacterized protein LOC133883337 [Phragmites australis]|uniref:uncharacterized protein LOC133883337 n=1 Tax=Phragmites australis TaxID=29695 RepID=UPI002D795ECF|nr:uncharacterized protein LOC133883337 [Phragmites australis]
MAMRRAGLVLPVIVAVQLLSAVLGTARPLAADGWAFAAGSTSGGPLPDGGVSVIEAIRQLYLQQLGGPGPSCETNSPNNRCPP